MTRTVKVIFALCGLAVVCVLVCSILSPFASFAFLPVCFILTYYASSRLHYTTLGKRPWLLFVVGALYGGGGLLFVGVNLFLIGGAVLFFALGLVAALRDKCTPLGEQILCAGVCLVVCVAVVGVFALVWHTGFVNTVVRAIKQCDADPILAFLAKRFYKKQTAESLGHMPLVPQDELYAAEVLAEYAHSIGRLLEVDALWYITGYGTFVGILTPLGALAIRQAAKKNDSFLRAEALLFGTGFLQSDVGAPVLGLRVEEQRLGHFYLKVVVLPVLVFSLFGFYEPMRVAVRPVFNVLITLPTTFCGITLLYHIAKLFKRKARVAAIIVFWLLMATAAVFWEWGLIILGFLGLGDAVLDMRKLLHWALN